MSRKIKVGKKVYDLISDRTFLETKVRETTSNLVPEETKSRYRPESDVFIVLKEDKNERTSFLFLVESLNIYYAIELVEKEIRKCHWIMTDDEGDEPIYTGFRNFSDLEDYYIIQKVSQQRILS